LTVIYWSLAGAKVLREEEEAAAAAAAAAEAAAEEEEERRPQGDQVVPPCVMDVGWMAGMSAAMRM
jgi:hypothetical protein